MSTRKRPDSAQRVGFVLRSVKHALPLTQRRSRLASSARDRTTIRQILPSTRPSGVVHLAIIADF